MVGTAGRDGDGAGDDLGVGIRFGDRRKRLLERFLLRRAGLGDVRALFGKLGIEELVGDARAFAGTL